MEHSELFLSTPEEGIDLPGAIPEGVSHGTRYDKVNFLVETYCVFGENKCFNLRTRVRRMTEMEIIHTKLEGHSREDVLRTFGVDLSKEKLVPLDLPSPPSAFSLEAIRKFMLNRRPPTNERVLFKKDPFCQT